MQLKIKIWTKKPAPWLGPHFVLKPRPEAGRASLEFGRASRSNAGGRGPRNEDRGPQIGARSATKLERSEDTICVRHRMRVRRTRICVAHIFEDRRSEVTHECVAHIRVSEGRRHENVGTHSCVHTHLCVLRNETHTSVCGVHTQLWHNCARSAWLWDNSTIVGRTCVCNTLVRTTIVGDTQVWTTHMCVQHTCVGTQTCVAHTSVAHLCMHKCMRSMPGRSPVLLRRRDLSRTGSNRPGCKSWRREAPDEKRNNPAGRTNRCPGRTMHYCWSHDAFLKNILRKF